MNSLEIDLCVVWGCMLVCVVWVGGCVQCMGVHIPEDNLHMVPQMPPTSFFLSTQDLSLAWNIPSGLAWLAKDHPSSVPSVLAFVSFTRVFGIEVNALCLQGKHFIN